MLIDKIKNPNGKALVLFPSRAEASRQAYLFFTKLPREAEPLFVVTSNRVVFPNGADIQFDGYSDDFERWQGCRYDYIGVTQYCPLTHDTEAFLRSRLRGPDGEFVGPTT